MEQRMHELLLLKAYSPHTIKTYCTEFTQLLYLLKDTPVDSLSPQRLRSYLLYCVTKLNLSENIIHSRMNANMEDSMPFVACRQCSKQQCRKQKLINRWEFMDYDIAMQPIC